MPQTVPTGVGVSDYSSTFDYSTFQFDLSLLSDDYGSTPVSLSPSSPHHLQVKPQQPQVLHQQIKQELRSPRPGSPSCIYPSPPYGLSPNYSRDASPAYPTSPYYVPQSPQSAQQYPTSPEPTAVAKQPVKREKSFDLLTILHESRFVTRALAQPIVDKMGFNHGLVLLNRLLAESLGYKEDSTDCTVPCTPPRTEEDIYNSLDADFFPPKREVESNPLLKEILFKEEARLSPSSTSCASSTCSSSSSIASSPAPAPVLDYEKSSLRELLFRNQPPKETEEAPREDVEESKGDHQLLREVLRDTSFQRKYNLRPFDLGSIPNTAGFVAEDMVVENGECVGDLASDQIEPVLSLAIQQLQKDFDNTCVALGIHPGK